jgi:hypothetical protein
VDEFMVWWYNTQENLSSLKWMSTT